MTPWRDARPSPGLTAQRSRAGLGVADTLTVAWRNLLAARIPQVIVFSTIQPVIFVLMFRYVFGNVDRAAPASPTSTS